MKIFINLILLITIIFTGCVYMGCETARPNEKEVANFINDMSVLPKNPDMVLLYYGYDTKGPRNWNTEKLKYYLAYYKDGGTESEKPVDTLFDTVLWMYRRSARGHLFESARNFKPTKEVDWQECMDRLFVPDLQLDALEKTAVSIEKELGKPIKINVILTLPYPDTRVEDWSDYLSGRSWNFYKNDKGRLKAIQWYIDAVIEKWNAAGFEHLDLIGFYWFNESHFNLRVNKEFMNDRMLDDKDIMHQTARYLHTRKVNEHPLTCSWIPYSLYAEKRLTTAAELYHRAPMDKIDYLMLQPNYYITRWNKKKSDLISATKSAASIMSGVEVEFDEKLVLEPELRQRFIDYLQVFQQYHPQLKEVPVGYYQGVQGVYEIATRTELHSYYDALYEFIKNRK